MKETPLLAADSSLNSSNDVITGNGSETSKNSIDNDVTAGIRDDVITGNVISHSRQSSVASSHSTESGGKLSLGGPPNSVTSSEELGDCHMGIVVALHRKMVRNFAQSGANSIKPFTKGEYS